MSWRTEGSERTGWPLTWVPEHRNIQEKGILFYYGEKGKNTVWMVLLFNSLLSERRRHLLDRKIQTVQLQKRISWEFKNFLCKEWTLSHLKLSTFLSICFCGDLFWINRNRLLARLCLLPFRFFSHAPGSLQARPPHTDPLGLLLLAGWGSLSFSLSDSDLPTSFIIYSLIGWWGAGNYISPRIYGRLRSLLRILPNIPQNEKIMSENNYYRWGSTKISLTLTGFHTEVGESHTHWYARHSHLLLQNICELQEVSQPQW